MKGLRGGLSHSAGTGWFTNVAAVAVLMAQSNRKREERRKYLSMTVAAVGVLMQVVAVNVAGVKKKREKKETLAEFVDTRRQVVVDTGEYRWCMHVLVCKTKSKVSNI